MPADQSARLNQTGPLPGSGPARLLPGIQAPGDDVSFYLTECPGDFGERYILR